jgi:hypothetical protein
MNFAGQNRTPDGKRRRGGARVPAGFVGDSIFLVCSWFFALLALSQGGTGMVNRVAGRPLK